MPREKLLRTRLVLASARGEAKDDVLYLYMKRLYLTAGYESLHAFCSRRYEDSDATKKAEDAFLLRLEGDGKRDDVHLSKCMHCLLNKCCVKYPGSCHFIDSKIPVHLLAFSVVEWFGRKLVTHATYDCGWLCRDGINPDTVSVMPDEIVLSQYPSTSFLKKEAPFSFGWSPYRAVPKRGETFKAFTDRVNEVVRRIKDERKIPKGDTKATLRKILAECGHSKELEEKYDGDVMFMASDWWPDMTPEEIVNMYLSEAKVSVRDFIDNRRRIEETIKENNNGIT